MTKHYYKIGTDIKSRIKHHPHEPGVFDMIDKSNMWWKSQPKNSKRTNRKGYIR